MKRIIRYIITTLVLVFLVVLIGWQLNKNKSTMEDNAEIANEKMTVFPVTIVSLQSETLSQNFNISGEFEPLHDLRFVSETAGRITSVKVKNGDYVKKGQVIAQLDNEQVRIDLKLAEANLEKAENDLVKYEKLLLGNAMTKQQVEEAKLAKISAENRVETLKRQLKTSTISSPISGTINGFSLEVGSYLSPGSAIAEIIDVTKLKMTVSLLDHEVILVAPGQEINVYPDLYPEAQLKGKISFVAAKADGSGKYEVEIEFANEKETPLKAGMTGSAGFEFGGEKTAMMIPVKCLVGSVQDPTVFVVNGDTVTSKKIKVGQIYGDKIEVTSGLTPNDKVVETGQSNLSEGSKIQIIE